MPCYMTGTAEGDRELARREQEDCLVEAATAQLTKTTAELTRMLCATCRALEENDIEIPRGVRTWWREHKRVDASNPTLKKR